MKFKVVAVYRFEFEEEAESEDEAMEIVKKNLFDEVYDEHPKVITAIPIIS